jgi:hypothetical protein
MLLLCAMSTNSMASDYQELRKPQETYLLTQSIVVSIV